MSAGTLYRRAVRRVERRSRTYIASRSAADLELLREACHLANSLFGMTRESGPRR